MPRIVKEFNALSIDDVRKIRGYKFSVLRKSTRNKIPDKPGVYIWRYWPNIPSLQAEKLIEVIDKLQRYFPRQEEILSNSRIGVTVERTPFGRLNDNRLLGIKGEKKIENFRQILKKDETIRQVFAHTLELLVSSSPPIYIGKADNLRRRLGEHFDNKTELLGRIESANLAKEDIYISYILDELTDDDCSVTTTIEEILQRLTNPAYTKRYG